MIHLHEQRYEYMEFKRYQKYVYPVEYALGHVWMDLLAFRIIVTGVLAGRQTRMNVQ
jgi:hypothetical protein